MSPFGMRDKDRDRDRDRDRIETAGTVAMASGVDGVVSAGRKVCRFCAEPNT